MTGQVLLGATLAVFLACVAMVVLVVVVKTGRTSRAGRRTAALAAYRADLIAVAAGEDEEGAAADRLVGATSPAREEVDRSAIELLGKIRGLPAEQLVSVLRRHGAIEEASRELADRSPVRRARAAQLLGLSREPGAVPALVAALDDGAVEVRTSAAYALGLIGDPAAARHLIAVLDTPDRFIPSGIAAEALLGMGVLISDDLRTALDSERPGARLVAAYVSGVGSFTKSLPRLRRLLATDPDTTVRQTCATSIGAIGGSEDVEALAAHTSPAHPLRLRRICASALGALGDPAGIPALAGLLDDPDPRLAELAADALVALGPEGRAALESHVEDDEPVRGRPVATALALASLRGVLS